jgi:hypothetical protein
LEESNTLLLRGGFLEKTYFATGFFCTRGLQRIGDHTEKRQNFQKFAKNTIKTGFLRRLLMALLTREMILGIHYKEG